MHLTQSSVRRVWCERCGPKRDFPIILYFPLNPLHHPAVLHPHGFPSSCISYMLFISCISVSSAESPTSGQCTGWSSFVGSSVVFRSSSCLLAFCRPPAPCNLSRRVPQPESSGCSTFMFNALLTVICVWLKIKQQGLRRFWSMFPLTRVPFWYRFFEPQ